MNKATKLFSKSVPKINLFLADAKHLVLNRNIIAGGAPYFVFLIIPRFEAERIIQ